MAAHLTAAEARRLGIDAGTATRSRTRPKSRGEATGPYRTRCRACAVVFDTAAGETAHLNETGHHAYELVLEPA